MKDQSQQQEPNKPEMAMRAIRRRFDRSWFIVYVQCRWTSPVGPHAIPTFGMNFMMKMQMLILLVIACMHCSSSQAEEIVLRSWGLSFHLPNGEVWRGLPVVDQDGDAFLISLSSGSGHLVQLYRFPANDKSFDELRTEVIQSRLEGVGGEVTWDGPGVLDREPGWRYEVRFYGEDGIARSGHIVMTMRAGNLFVVDLRSPHGEALKDPVLRSFGASIRFRHGDQVPNKSEMPTP